MGLGLAVVAEEIVEAHFIGDAVGVGAELFVGDRETLPATGASNVAVAVPVSSPLSFASLPFASSQAVMAVSPAAGDTTANAKPFASVVPSMCLVFGVVFFTPSAPLWPGAAGLPPALVDALFLSQVSAASKLSKLAAFAGEGAVNELVFPLTVAKNTLFTGPFASTLMFAPDTLFPDPSRTRRVNSWQWAVLCVTALGEITREFGLSLTTVTRWASPAPAVRGMGKSENGMTATAVIWFAPIATEQLTLHVEVPAGFGGKFVDPHEFHTGPAVASDVV